MIKKFIITIVKYFIFCSLLSYLFALIIFVTYSYHSHVDYVFLRPSAASYIYVYPFFLTIHGSIASTLIRGILYPAGMKKNYKIYYAINIVPIVMYAALFSALSQL